MPWLRNLRSKRVSPLFGWEQFDPGPSAIVSIGAFEHFGHELRRVLPAWRIACCPLSRGSCLLHTITRLHRRDPRAACPCRFTFARFLKFIVTEIFPGGPAPSIPMVQECASANGFTVTRVQSSQPHYAKTLDLWSAALQTTRDQAIAAIRGSLRAMKYLTGCAECFASDIDVNQFTCQK